MTKDEVAQKAGLKTYDCALPQTWLDGVVHTLKQTSTDHCGKLPEDIYHRILLGTVWCYDGSLLGFPHALTEEVKGYLKVYEEAERKKHEHVS